MSSDTVTTLATRPASSCSGDLVVSRMRSPLRQRAADLLLEARQRRRGLEHLGVEHRLPGRVVLAVDLLERAADRARRLDAVELLVGAVDQRQAAVDVDRADDRRHRVDQPAQAQLARAQRGLVLLAARQQLAAQLVGALLEQLLLPAQGQKVPRAGAELDVVDRAQQEVGRPGVERLVAVAALLVSGDHHDRDVAGARQRAERADEVGAVHARHLVVGDHEIGDRGLHPVERRLRAGEGLDADAFLDRDRESGEDVPVGHAIVDDDYIRHGHSALGFARAGVRGYGGRTLLSRRSIFHQAKGEKRADTLTPGVIFSKLTSRFR